MDRGDDFVVVDTLEAEYYRNSHLPGAINLPLEEVDRAEEVLPDKEAEIVVYCMNTMLPASLEAARELAARDYTNVRDYEEGKRGWIEAGLPYESNH
ncbi:MAG: rhodanese-like domain-containing protein [Actinobacteria bacterium]|nr:rhodanese-like domain-containing protein [Actinomycetota bacterium]